MKSPCFKVKSISYEMKINEKNINTIFQENVFENDGCQAISPRERQALAWGPSSFHTKIFRVERTRLKTIENITNSL